MADEIGIYEKRSVAGNLKSITPSIFEIEFLNEKKINLIWTSVKKSHKKPKTNHLRFLPFFKLLNEPSRTKSIMAKTRIQADSYVFCGCLYLCVN